MRKISKVSVHCMLSNIVAHDNVETLYQWHVVDNGWKWIGYHIYIDRHGKVFDEHNHKLMRPYSITPASVKNHNTGMIGICLWGRDERDFTPAQIKSLREVVNRLVAEHKLKPIDVKGHNEYSGHETRGCPGMDVRKVIFNTRGVHQTH